MKIFIYLLLLVSSVAFSKTKGPAPSVSLYNITDNVAIVSENTDIQRPLASLTKIMTAMVTLDQWQTLGDTLVLDRKVKPVLPAGKYTRLELLNALLVRSDNAAAETLAINYPGGRSAFLEAMNNRAKALGMNNTHFDDPSGLINTNVSTAQDVSLMLIASMNYPLIKQISIQKQAQFEAYYKKKVRKVVLPNTNSRLLFEFDNIVITKTGYTTPAGFCLGLVVEQKGKYYTVVIMGTPTPLFRLNLARRLLNIDINYNTLLDSDLK
jgi:D-alanyl-D-alanine endopeptidase (penicillin-binding protein 7)